MTLDHLSTRQSRNRSREWTWPDIKDAVENSGRILFICESNVYDVTAWAKNHPGGELALRHVNGKDATDHVRVLHPPYVLKEKLPMFRVGTFKLPDDHVERVCAPLIVDPTLYPNPQALAESPMKPIMDNPHLAPAGNYISSIDHPAGVPLESSAFTAHTAKVLKLYRALDAHMRETGMYKTRMSFYVREAVKLIAMFAAVQYMVIKIIGPASRAISTSDPSYLNAFAYWSWVLVAAVSLGLYWHQSAFVAHDAGHISVTGHYTTDWAIGLTIGNILGGISIGWWKSSHNTHHVITNHPEHDPDIQHLPVIAITPLFFRDLWSSFHRRTLCFDKIARTFVPFQHYLYYPIMMVARFNLYVQSYIFLFKDKDTNKSARIELAGLTVFWIWLTALLNNIDHTPSIVVFVLVSHAITFLLHLQITLSHFAMSVHEVSPHESFPARMLRTTMDVDCPDWLDWFHGGLQFQTIHHLFPRLPRTSFRSALPLIQKFSQDSGLRYIMVPFLKGNQMIIGNMREVSRQLRIVFRTEQLKLD